MKNHHSTLSFITHGNLINISDKKKVSFTGPNEIGTAGISIGTSETCWKSEENMTIKLKGQSSHVHFPWENLGLPRKPNSPFVPTQHRLIRRHHGRRRRGGCRKFRGRHGGCLDDVFAGRFFRFLVLIDVNKCEIMTKHIWVI